MLRTSVFKCLQIGTMALFVLALTLSAAGAQSAQAATDSQISAGWMPFAGSLYDSQTTTSTSMAWFILTPAGSPSPPASGRWRSRSISRRLA